MPVIATDTFSQIAYTKEGKGPCLVLLHGFPESGTLWKNNIPALAQHYTVIAPDMPGTGNSRWEAHVDLRMETMADILKAILDKEQLSSAVLAGHSMGGYLALVFAALYPAYVKGIVLIHSNAGADNEEKKESRRKAIALIQKGGKEAFIRQMIPNLYADAFVANNKEYIEKSIEQAMQISAEALCGFYEAMIYRTDKTGLLIQNAFPFMWLIGKEDKLMPYESLVKQSTLSDVSLVKLYENCGHMSMIEQPEHMEKDLLYFLSYCYNA